MRHEGKAARARYLKTWQLRKRLSENKAYSEKGRVGFFKFYGICG